MQRLWRLISRVLFSSRGLLILGLLVWGFASCARRSQNLVDSQVTSGWPRPNVIWSEAQYDILRVAYPQVPDAELVGDDELCMTCHETYVKTFAHNVHRGQKCEDCHGPASRHLITRGQEPGSILSFKKLPPAERSEICLKCHEQNQCEPGARWRTSVHAHNGVSCTDCHTGHYNVPPGTPPTAIPGEGVQPASLQRVAHYQDEQPPMDQAAIRRASNNMGAISPQVCYRCHGSMVEFEQVAHPHQMLGSNSFTCSTCHDSHGKIRHETRTELCLECHKGAPNMAWHSSTHSMHGVACTDCHSPHPSTAVPDFVDISHTSIARPKRMPMSVNEPYACFKCHPKVYAETSLPSHHPIKEGKMVCSDCHDGHGQAQGNLKEVTTNLVCYRCHAEKQGPFVWEHPPVTQDCGICHNPHGTVANNLLHQPTTFLCLRCHAGHRGQRRNIDADPTFRPALYSDCSQCHAQVHGSDLPGVTRTPRLTR